MLCHGVGEGDPFRWLAIINKFVWVSFKWVYLPILSVVSIESLGIEGSPIAKGNIVFSLFSTSEISLLFPLFSPGVTFSRPWAIIFAGSPWVSHFNESMDYLSIIILKLYCSDDSVSVTRNHVVMTDLASGGHWVFFTESVNNNIPKLSIGHLVRVVGRYWHTSNSSESLSWSTTRNLGVVYVQFGESFLHKN